MVSTAALGATQQQTFCLAADAVCVAGPLFAQRANEMVARARQLGPNLSKSSNRMVAALREAFARKDFVVTAEIGPPKGTDVSELLHHVDLLKDKVDGLNVTDNQSSVMRISSLAVCRLILDHGDDPIEPQLLKSEKKITAWAKFIQTQAIYDLDKFQRFMEQARRPGVKIMAGIVLLVSAGMARYMNKNVPDILKAAE